MTSTGNRFKNRVVVTIESGRRGGVSHRTRTEHVFSANEFTLKDVLVAFEGALRGFGYDCPLESLVVDYGAKP